jgi:hypothetical protein
MPIQSFSTKRCTLYIYCQLYAFCCGKLIISKTKKKKKKKKSMDLRFEI